MDSPDDSSDHERSDQFLSALFHNQLKLVKRSIMDADLNNVDAANEATEASVSNSQDGPSKMKKKEKVTPKVTHRSRIYRYNGIDQNGPVEKQDSPGHRFPLLSPPKVDDIENIDEDELRATMLKSWYMAGYYAGYYDAITRKKD